MSAGSIGSQNEMVVIAHHREGTEMLMANTPNSTRSRA
jgi:hypothetical protein